MVQTGDPTHTGKGGLSIWGRKFEDEFKENLKVSPYLKLFVVFINNIMLFNSNPSIKNGELYRWPITDLTLIVASFSLPMLRNPT